MRLLGIFTKAVTPWLLMLTRKYEDKDGKLKSWEYATRRKPLDIGYSRKTNAVVIEGWTKANELVLIKQPRIPLTEPQSRVVVYELGLPAGLIDGGESPYMAAERELGEETGYRITHFFGTSPLLASSPGMTDECATIVYCRVERVGEPDADEETEVILAKSTTDYRIEKAMIGCSYVWGTKAYLCLKKKGK